MLTNHHYNILAQLCEESKSLQRIKDCYLPDGDTCNECSVFWQKMLKDKEAHIQDLTDLLKKHLVTMGLHETK